MNWRWRWWFRKLQIRIILWKSHILGYFSCIDGTQCVVCAKYSAKYSTKLMILSDKFIRNMYWYCECCPVFLLGYTYVLWLNWMVFLFKEMKVEREIEEEISTEIQLTMSFNTFSSFLSRWASIFLLLLLLLCFRFHFIHTYRIRYEQIMCDLTCDAQSCTHTHTWMYIYTKNVPLFLVTLPSFLTHIHANTSARVRTTYIKWDFIAAYCNKAFYK